MGTQYIFVEAVIGLDIYSLLSMNLQGTNHENRYFLVMEFCLYEKPNVLIPKAVSDTVSHCTLTAKLMPFIRDTFKYTALLASSMLTEVALKKETK